MSSIILETDRTIQVGKIICIGQNYKKHIEELQSIKNKDPLIFMKPSTSILNEGEEINLPDFSNEVHHETELALLIGKKGKNIPPGKWKSFVSGVGIALDLTLRDIQREAKEKGHPWIIAKGFDGSCPISRFVSLKNIENVQDLKIQLFVNNELRQEGFTRDMIWSVDELLVYISKIFTLEPGDIILTGTPDGVGKIIPGDHLKAVVPDVGKMEYKVK